MTLLAKSGRGQKTLLQHTDDVLQMATWLFGHVDAPTRLAEKWLRFFQIENKHAFYNCVAAAAAFHDWGKANDGFQRALQCLGKQLIRHEHLSALLLTLPSVEQWLATRNDVDWEIVLSAVVSHHLKANFDTLASKQGDGPRFVLAKVPGEHRDYLEFVGQRIGLDATKLPELPMAWHFGSGPAFNLIPHREKLKARLNRIDTALAGDLPRHRLLWAVRGALIAADAAGSAVDRMQQLPRDFVQCAFDPERVQSSETVWTKIINPRIKQLAAHGRWDLRNGDKGWNLFQIECARQPARTLLLAPCGSGKTLAAWRWIAAQLEQSPAARVIFLYPTRATATEGFRDYVSWAPESEAALVHGTAEFDLDGMFENPPDSDDPRQDCSYEVERRLFAIALWSRRVFSATVDQFFAFLQYQYGPVCLLPLLVDSVVVVDEVHSFDPAMFSALKQFLISFPTVPVLCMTASLPQHRREELESKCHLRVYDEKPADLREVAEHSRYRVQRIEASDVPARIRTALLAGKRVLWVVNQVKRAQAEPLRLLQSGTDLDPLEFMPGIPLHCYHSRFRLLDRRDRHRAVVQAFQGKRQAVLGITTQVCEMSLDLDADVLITELAPITAVIQRMGRCNRQARPDEGRIGEVYLYQPENERPYNLDLLAGVNDFVDRLCRQAVVSQADLEAALEEFGPQLHEPDRTCSFLESGPFAMGGEQSFRDLEEFSVQAILDIDIESYLAASREEAPGFGLPVPKKLGQQRDLRLPDYMRVASSAHYHPAVGFCDQPI